VPTFTKATAMDSIGLNYWLLGLDSNQQLLSLPVNSRTGLSFPHPGILNCLKRNITFFSESSRDNYLCGKHKVDFKTASRPYHLTTLEYFLFIK